jgi:hypothetical protein
MPVSDQNYTRANTAGRLGSLVDMRIGKVLNYELMVYRLLRHRCGNGNKQSLKT